MKRIISFFLVFALVFHFAACASKQDSIKTGEVGVIHEPEFGGVYIEITIDDFNNEYGFEFGDSVNVYFSNGYSQLDIPYYNGYYVKPGEKLLIGYPGYDYIKYACNFGDDMFIVAELSEDDTAYIELNERGKYLGIQDARNITYLDDRELYPSDEIFANFRSCNVGNLKSDFLYRSASPCDNQHNRAHYVDSLMREAGVNYILDLADNESKVQGYMASDDFSSDYYAELYERGDVGLLSLSANYSSPDFMDKLVNGIIEMIDHDGPYLVHCTEGKDRTGFVIILFEMLAGATYDEMLEDYMMTYFNYYGIAEFNEPEKYRLIKENLFDDMIRMIMGVDEDFDITNVDFVPYAEAFLLDDVTISQEQVNTLKDKLTK